MDLKFRPYNPLTNTFMPSDAGCSPDQQGKKKKPCRTKARPGSKHYPGQSRFSDYNEFPPLECHLDTETIDLTGEVAEQPVEPDAVPQHHSSIVDGNDSEKPTAGHEDDDPNGCIPLRVESILPRQNDKQDTSEERTSSLAVSQSLHQCPNEVVPDQDLTTPPRGNSLDQSKAVRSVSFADPLVSEARHCVPRSSPAPSISIAEEVSDMAVDKGDQGIMAKEAEETVLGDKVVGRDGATSPAPPHTEDGPEALADREHGDQVMVDADDVVHGHVGDSIVENPTGEQSKPDLLAGNGDWEITALAGKEIIAGVVHYLVQWKPTLVPEHEINAPELVGEFEIRFGTPKNQSVRGGKIAKKTSSKFGRHGKDTNASRRRRPRKDVLDH